MSKKCIVCRNNNVFGNAKSCGDCRDFYLLASAVFDNKKRLEKVNKIDFPVKASLANHLKELFKIQKGKCKYTDYDMKLPYTHPEAIGSGTMCSPDREDPRKGYSKDNIVLVLSRINIMKNDIESEEDFYHICKRFVERYENKNSHFIDPSNLSEEDIIDLMKKMDI